MKSIFGHLQGEDFMNLIEAGTLPEAKRVHLSACAACQTQLQTADSTYRSLSGSGDEGPEPDWAAFRESVRLELLSRAVQRDSTVRRWTGWAVRPALAWSMALLFAIGLGAGALLWHVSQDRTRDQMSSTTAEALPGDDSLPLQVIPTTVDPVEIDAVMAAWSNTNVFAEASKLEESQADQLRKLIESASKGTIEQP